MILVENFAYGSSVRVRGAKRGLPARVPPFFPQVKKKKRKGKQKGMERRREEKEKGAELSRTFPFLPALAVKPEIPSVFVVILSPFP